MLWESRDIIIRRNRFGALLIIIALLFLLLYFYIPSDDSFQYMIEMRHSQEQAIRAIEQGDMVRAHDILSKSISDSYKRERLARERE
jgi:hypothetical protein